MLRFIDIGANLTDPMFQGIYGKTLKHQPDLNQVLERAWSNGLEKIIITVGSLSEADAALSLAKKDERLLTTMGCHPTRCGEFDSNVDQYYSGLCSKIEENRKHIVAIGECGLDYDRLHFCAKEVQQKYFEKQLDLVEKYKLPLFLHCRNAHNDFMQILQRNRSKLSTVGGVVHSFDGTIDEANRIIDFGLYIGINGCSLKTQDNLNTVSQIPLNKIMLETDSPWCGIRPSHAGANMIRTKFQSVKKKENWKPDLLIDGRNEPCQIRQVLDVIAEIKEEQTLKLAEIFYENTMMLFFDKSHSIL